MEERRLAGSVRLLDGMSGNARIGALQPLYRNDRRDRDLNTSVDCTGRLEAAIGRFHSETMPLMRAPFRKLRDDMAAELNSRLKSLPEGRAREVLSLATTLISTLK